MEQHYIPDLFALRKAISHKNQNYWIERVVSGLPQLIAKAADSVNSRKRHFNLDKPGIPIPTSYKNQRFDEAKLEAWCLSRWSIRNGIKAPKPIPNAWERLIARQVPLEPPIYQRNLLTADLVGISEDGFPVIVELKWHTKQVTILGFILQTLDYGIRLRESWHYFFGEWQHILAKYNWPKVQSQPQRIYLVCAAPADIWKHERQPRRAPNLMHYVELKKSLDFCGFPLSLVSLNARNINKVGFHIIAQPFDFV